MKYRRRIFFTDKQKSEIWDRWQRGESMSSIGRGVDRRALPETGAAILLPEVIGITNKNRTLGAYLFLKSALICSAVASSIPIPGSSTKFVSLSPVEPTKASKLLAA